MWVFFFFNIYLFIWLLQVLLHVGSFFVALGLSFLAAKLGCLLRHSSSGARRLSTCSTQARLPHGMWEY